TTGRGAPQGVPFVPTIKITGNPSTAQHLREFIDVDVSEIISGDLNLENAAARIINEVIFVSSGKLTQAEKNRYEDSMNIYTTGPIL
ncbi:MAG: UxaA family hydrolase, partial [Methanomassiliicoccales archaeon]